MFAYSLYRNRKQVHSHIFQFQAVKDMGYIILSVIVNIALLCCANLMWSYFFPFGKYPASKLDNGVVG